MQSIYMPLILISADRLYFKLPSSSPNSFNLPYNDSSVRVFPSEGEEDEQAEDGEIVGGDGDTLSSSSSRPGTAVAQHPLEHSWTFWLYTFSIVEDFWSVKVWMLDLQNLQQVKDRFIYGKPDVPKATPEISLEVQSELGNFERSYDWHVAVQLVTKAGDPTAQSLPANDWYRLRRKLEIIKVFMSIISYLDLRLCR